MITEAAEVCLGLKHLRKRDKSLDVQESRTNLNDIRSSVTKVKAQCCRTWQETFEQQPAECTFSMEPLTQKIIKKTLASETRFPRFVAFILVFFCMLLTLLTLFKSWWARKKVTHWNTRKAKVECQESSIFRNLTRDWSVLHA